MVSNNIGDKKDILNYFSDLFTSIYIDDSSFFNKPGELIATSYLGIYVKKEQ